MAAGYCHTGSGTHPSASLVTAICDICHNVLETVSMRTANGLCGVGRLSPRNDLTLCHISRAALFVADAGPPICQTRRRTGGGRRHQGSNQRQSDRARDTECADCITARSSPDRLFCSHQQTGFRQFLNGHQHHRFVNRIGEFLCQKFCDFRMLFSPSHNFQAAAAGGFKQCPTLRC
jgi:hypothetical protein